MHPNVWILAFKQEINFGPLMCSCSDSLLKATVDHKYLFECHIVAAVRLQFLVENFIEQKNRFFLSETLKVMFLTQ